MSERIGVEVGRERIWSVKVGQESGRVGQERVLGESGARMWVREWGKRERVWGESGMREVQDRGGKGESEDGFQVRRGKRKCRQSGTRKEARERQKTEGGERQKRK